MAETTINSSRRGTTSRNYGSNSADCSGEPGSTHVDVAFAETSVVTIRLTWASASLLPLELRAIARAQALYEEVTRELQFT